MDCIGQNRLQVCFFSATLHSPQIKQLADSICVNPTWVDLRGEMMMVLMMMMTMTMLREMVILIVEFLEVMILLVVVMWVMEAKI